MTQPAQSHLFNCVLWHGIDNGNVRHFTPPPPPAPPPPPTIYPNILTPTLYPPTLHPLLRHFNPRHYPCKPDVSSIYMRPLYEELGKSAKKW